MAQIKFIQLSQAKYDSYLTDKSLSAYPESSIFFTTDTNRIYKGSVLFTGFQIVNTIPIADTARKNCLYVVSTTGDMYIKQGTEIKQVGGNSAAMATANANIASNYSAISAISKDIYATSSGFADRLTQAEKEIDALGAIGDVSQFVELVAGKMDTDDFNTYSSATSATLATLRSDINTNAGNISSNAADIDALESSLSALTTSSAVEITSADGSGDVVKVYTITQGGETVGTINIPKDLVVTSGSVVKGTWTNADFTQNSNGTGTALKLVIANQTKPVYINTLDLVKDHTGSTENGITVDISDTNVISVSIADSSIAKAKLTAAVQASLDKADTAYQSSDFSNFSGLLDLDMNGVKDRVTALQNYNNNSLAGVIDSAIDAKIALLDSSATAQAGKYINSITMVDGKITAIGEVDLPTYTMSSGSANGTVSFNGKDVAVTGLNSAAFAETTDFDAAGAAAAVLGSSDDAVGAMTVNGLSKSIALLNDATAEGSVAHQVAQASSNAVEAANSYTDSALAWQVIQD